MLDDGPPAAPVINVTIPEGRVASARSRAPSCRTTGCSGSYLDAAALRPCSTYAATAPRAGAHARGLPVPGDLRAQETARTCKDLVAEQLAAFKQNLAQVILRRAHSKNLTDYDVLTIASMIEREAQVPQRAPPDRRGDLQPPAARGSRSASTRRSRYELERLHHAADDLATSRARPYNTRHRHGPAADADRQPRAGVDPGRGAPGEHAYLYYVVKPGTCGAHAFSATYAQFQDDVQRYDAGPRGRGRQVADEVLR